jgi:membrane protein implicated in regulation of membrane protease activity
MRGHTHVVVLLLIVLAFFLFLTPGQAYFLSIPLLLFFVWLSWLTWRDMRRPATTGIEGIVGGKTQVVSRTKDGVKVLLRGELWNAVSDDPLTIGESVEIIGLEGMKLIVRKETKSGEAPLRAG